MNKFNVGDKVSTKGDTNKYGHCFDPGQVVTVACPKAWGFDVVDGVNDFYAEGVLASGDLVVQYLPEDEFELVK